MKNKKKVKSSIKKRFFLVSGGIKRWSPNTSHLMRKKTSKQKRHLRKTSYLNSSDYKRIKSII